MVNGNFLFNQRNDNLQQKHGRGILICSNGTRYDGYFRNDKPNIYGIIKFNNGETYDGNRNI